MPRVGAGVPGLVVNVNVSAGQFDDEHFADKSRSKKRPNSVHVPGIYIALHMLADSVCEWLKSEIL